MLSTAAGQSELCSYGRSRGWTGQSHLVREGFRKLMRVKMRTSCIVFAVLICCVVWFLPTPAISFQNEPKGFRDIEWASNISGLAGMSVFFSQRDIKLCSRKADKMAIGDAVLDKIVYVFYKDQLTGIIISFHSLSTFQALKGTLFEQYGEGEQSDPLKEKYFWAGETTIIRLDLTPVSYEGTLSFRSRALLIQQQIDEQERAGAKGNL